MSLVTVLPLIGLGSSNGAVNVNNSAIWTPLHKPPLQLPWIPRHHRRHRCSGNARGFVLPRDTHLRKDCDVHDYVLRYDAPTMIDDMVLRYDAPTMIDDMVLRYDAPTMIDDMVLRYGTSPRNVGDACAFVLRPGTPPRKDNSQRNGYGNNAHSSIKSYEFMGDELVRFWTCRAASYINGSLVRLVFHQDGNILTILAGTIIRSDGIIATSASCLSFLEGKELKKVTVDVEHLVKQKIYKGVLLDAGVCSNIAFVKITSRVHLASAVFGNLDHLLSGSCVVAASCSTLGSLDLFQKRHAQPADGLPNSNCLDWAKPNFVVGLFSCVAYEEENNEPQSARTSGQIIKAAASNSLDTAVGGCLVDPRRGVVGIIHKANPYNAQIEASPIVFEPGAL